MINNREYRIKSSRFREIRDQVHGHHLERSRMGVSHDRLKGSFLMRGAQFVLLTNCASSYIAFCEVLHVFSLVGLTEKVYGVRYAQMTCERVVVVCLQHSAFVFYYRWEVR